MNRRQLLRLPLAGGLVMLLGGHTPYGQWVVYREKHLLIACHRADPRTYELAQRVVGVLDEHLPEASARVARAPDAGRLASLLATDQLEVAVLGESDATAMLAGGGSFAAYGAIRLRLLAPVGDRLLVARANIPDRHAWLVTAALAGSELSPEVAGLGAFAVPWHPGSTELIRGRPVPPGPQGG